MARYHGKGSVVYISTSGSGTAVQATALNQWTLNMPTDVVEVSAFGDTNKQYVQGLPDITGTLSGWWDDTSDELYDASRSTDGVKLYLYPSTSVTTKYWYGTAWADFSINTGSAQGVAISGSFRAKGAWGQM